MAHVAHETNSWLLVSEAASTRRVSPWIVRRWVREGRLRSIRPGHRRLVSRDDVERLLAVPAHTAAPPNKESGSGET